MCLNSSTIPSEWKVHKICPIHKKGSILEANNYRPISLLCIISKIMEAIVFDKVITFIETKISVAQFGFRKGRSCLMNLLKSFNYIFEGIDNKLYTDVIYFDFKKAFDSVPHNELLCKLWKIGITGPLWHWFKFYLTNRLHYVIYDGAKSACLPVISGVP